MTDTKKNEVSVDTPGCIGCGACVGICPTIFKFNDENRSVVNKQPENQEELDCAKQAESVCPVQIIHVKD